MAIFRLTSVVTLCISIVGCSENPQSIVFTIDGDKPTRSYSFFPIVESNGKLVLGRATAKIADASGYQDWTISAKYPQNLATPWRTSRLDHHNRVGVVVLIRDESNKPIHDSARVFWLNTETINSGKNTIAVRLPAFDSLPLFEIQPQWM
jgi:hypothetical protein